MTDIREAAAVDARALAELRWEFRSSKTPPVESRDAFVDRCDAWMSQQLTAGTWRAWVAERDGRIVGQIWLQVLSKVPNPAEERERNAYISNVYVTPSARGGIGTRLVQTAVDWARSNGIDRIVLWPTPQSRAMYQRQGFLASGNLFELHVP